MLEFIRQYIDVYDQDDRSPLSAAYHPNSMFSMCAVYPAGTTAHGAQRSGARVSAKGEPRQARVAKQRGGDAL